MNAQHIDNKPKVQKETKNKIRVEFERAPLKERLKAKFLSLYFLKKVVWYIFRLILLIGISYIVLFPFFSKIASSFMSPEDLIDVTVRLIPKNFTLDIYKAIWTERNYVEAFSNTLFLSASSALVQTFICCFVAYGLAKFKFKGNGLVFLAVVVSLTIPHQTIQLALRDNFRSFDILGLIELIKGQGLNLNNTFWPLIILSVCGLAFKNGLYIFMLRQFFRGVPDELEESAYIDGSGVMRTFFTIILPLSIPMMITVFLFAFSWQWTDDFYTTIFFTTGSNMTLMPDIIKGAIPTSLKTDSTYTGVASYQTAIRNTGGIMIIAPLIVMYLFCQRYLVQGIERSGLTAD